jgi:gas vesicle protein
MFVNPNIAPRIQSQDQVLSDIITAIPTKEQSRDNKILEIIGDVENKFPWAMSEESQKKLVKIDQEVDEKIDQNKDETKKENKSKLRKILSVLLLNKWCKTRS